MPGAYAGINLPEAAHIRAGDRIPVDDAMQLHYN
jgi:hypothetical protein